MSWIITFIWCKAQSFKANSYFLCPRVRKGPLWFARCKKRHSPVSTRVCTDPSADIRMQLRICDHADCLLWKRADCTCSFTCVNSVTLDLTSLTVDTLIHSNIFKLKDFSLHSTTTTTTTKNTSHWGMNVLSFMSAEPLFLSPVVSAWTTRIYLKLQH